MNKILVISPTYNEIDNIDLFINSLLAEDVNIDILIVDDASPDGTGDYIQSHTLFNDRIFLISRSSKMGLGSAYCEGFKWALKADYNKIVQMDADLSHNPKYLKQMLEAAETNDLVIGSRYIDGINVVNWPMSRLILSYLANIYCLLILGIKIKDFTGGFKCFNRVVLNQINLDDVKSEGYSFQVEMNLKAHVNGFSIKEVPIIFNDRTEALNTAFKLAMEDDIIVILGKGREEYQEVKGEKLFHSDYKIVNEWQ